MLGNIREGAFFFFGAGKGKCGRRTWGCNVSIIQFLYLIHLGE